MIYMNNMAVCNYIVGVLGAVIGGLITVSYTHLTLPTICSV